MSVGYMLGDNDRFHDLERELEDIIRSLCYYRRIHVLLFFVLGDRDTLAKENADVCEWKLNEIVREMNNYREYFRGNTEEAKDMWLANLIAEYFRRFELEASVRIQV